MPRCSVFAIYRWYDGSVSKWCCCSSLCVDAGKIDINLQNEHFQTLHQNRVQNIFHFHDNNIKNRCVLKIYIIVLRPIFDWRYKEKKRLKYTFNIHIMIWSYSNNLGISFAMYQRMRLKGASWDGPRLHLGNIFCRFRRLQ